jgi:hypothetical protein
MRNVESTFELELPKPTKRPQAHEHFHLQTPESSRERIAQTFAEIYQDFDRRAKKNALLDELSLVVSKWKCSSYERTLDDVTTPRDTDVQLVHLKIK